MFDPNLVWIKLKRLIGAKKRKENYSLIGLINSFWF